MSIPPLTIIPAGAGSGKTHTIQTQLAQWVIDGLVAPDRIVAVTFTEAAASELRERIRAELTKRGRLEDALKLEQSYITTIHGFGLRLLTEFAFDNGMSPKPRLLNEDESNILIRRALSETDRADEVMTDLSAFGYDYDFNSGKGAEELFRDAVLALIGKLRSVGKLQEDDRLIPHAAGIINRIYGTTTDGAVANNNLHAAVIKLLNKYPHELTTSYGNNDTAIKALRDDYRNLKLAEKGDTLGRNWVLWQKLRKLRITAMPDDYKSLAQDVMTAASELPHHPGPLNDALAHAKALLGAAQDALSRYAEEKRNRGLVDYTDMLAIAHNLLSDRHDVLEVLKNRIDCLIIDEFQDTNPLEFALLWELQREGVPTLIVGDLKQAIMGFQNADPRLMETLQKQHSKQTRPLTSNWRSTPALMELINRIGSGLFGEEYTELTPKADFPSTTKPIELLSFIKGDKISDRTGFTVNRIQNLLADESQTIYDKKQGTVRRLRAGDIAVLCPTNARLATFAEVMREHGVHSLIEQEGWYESRIVQLLVAILHYVADPTDRHAILTLCVTEFGSHTLESALTALIAGEQPADPLLASLQSLLGGAADRSVATVLNDIITTLSLFDRISAWPDSEQARANLLRLQHESHEFMESNLEALASGGYYGSGIKTFLAWLAARAERENSQPEPRVIDEEAVQLISWHRSKGREWPVVIVASTDCAVSPRLPEVSVEYTDFSDLSTVLDNALIEISPKFVAPEANDRFIDQLMNDSLDSAGRLLYVALTRAREKLIVEWPEFQGKSSAKAGSYWSLLTAKTGMSLSGSTLTVMDKTFECLVSNYPGGVIGTHDEQEMCVEANRSDFGRLAIKPAMLPGNLTPESVSPSSLHDEDAEKVDNVIIHRYGDDLKLALSVEGVERGLLLHRCFELMSGNSTISKEKLTQITGYEFIDIQYSELCKASQKFNQWVDHTLQPIETANELPVLSCDVNGSIINGFIDLLIETATGFWIIDHKSDQTDNLELRFARYLPQLNCYADAVKSARPDKPVLGVGINWISNSSVSMFESIFACAAIKPVIHI